MDILERMKCRIIEEFPNITDDELVTRLRLATHIIDLKKDHAMTIEKIAVLLIQDPIALAVHVYHMTKWPSSDRYEISWDDKIPIIADNFNITSLEVKKALNYLENCGIG